MWNLISTRISQFSYFDQLLGGPRWRGSKIMDLGGNVGTFLKGAGAEVAHEDYWCIDVNKEVLDLGRKEYPRAHFVHFNRYGAQYNPNGVRYLPLPSCGFKFDIMLAFSMFTHVHENEIIELVWQMRNMLSPHGVLAFTFSDARYDRTLTDPVNSISDGITMIERARHEKQPGGVDHMIEKARHAKWFLVIDDEIYIEPGIEWCHQQREGRPLESYCSFFTPEHIQLLFPDGQVCAPVCPEWQHCCILRNQ